MGRQNELSDNPIIPMKSISVVNDNALFVPKSGKRIMGRQNELSDNPIIPMTG